jgi:hypothetical protein
MNLAIVGNSLSAPTPIHALAWPAIAATCMPGVNVTNWAVDGNTAFRQNASGQNVLIAASKPDVIIIGSNYNETISNVDNRTLAEVTQDAFELFDWYKANIPGVRIIHMQELSGYMGTPEYAAFLAAVKTGRQWDGYMEMNYETCIAAAQLIGQAFVDTPPIHPARITCHMQAAEIVGQLIQWFGLPIQLPQWASVEAFIAGYKAGDPWALAAAKSLTT